MVNKSEHAWRLNPIKYVSERSCEEKWIRKDRILHVDKKSNAEKYAVVLKSISLASHSFSNLYRISVESLNLSSNCGISTLMLIGKLPHRELFFVFRPRIRSFDFFPLFAVSTIRRLFPLSVQHATLHKPRRHIAAVQFTSLWHAYFRDKSFSSRCCRCNSVIPHRRIYIIETTDRRISATLLGDFTCRRRLVVLSRDQSSKR